MAGKLAEAFKRGWVRLAPASGLPRKRVAADLGIGLSTLTRWVSCKRCLASTLRG